MSRRYIVTFVCVASVSSALSVVMIKHDVSLCEVAKHAAGMSPTDALHRFCLLTDPPESHVCLLRVVSLNTRCAFEH